MCVLPQPLTHLPPLVVATTCPTLKVVGMDCHTILHADTIGGHEGSLHTPQKVRPGHAIFIVLGVVIVMIEHLENIACQQYAIQCSRR